jgi:signal transduction histidine kinase
MQPDVSVSDMLEDRVPSLRANERPHFFSPTARRERAKERLYVFCQLGGWGIFLLLQLFVGRYFARGDGRIDYLQQASSQVVVVAMGLLLIHYARHLMTRWGWKELGWRQLVPRVLGAAFALAFVWCAAGFLYSYGILKLPGPGNKMSPAVMFCLGWLNLTVIFVGWMCLYFFYHLFDRFNRSEIERLRLAAHAKESELRSLKSQVNPHFIFNSLNSLRALIDENPARARQAVTQLANLLRYSLQSGQHETVPFEDELRIVNDYLALEQVRHEERLRVRLDVEPDTLTLPVPPMLLQTLVENAVKYGISTRTEGGEIAIIARRENNTLRLQVTNPGELATPASRERQASTGVGLRNAAERLRLLFGDTASLQLRADKEKYVIAEAIVPLAVNHT